MRGAATGTGRSSSLTGTTPSCRLAWTCSPSSHRPSASSAKTRRCRLHPQPHTHAPGRAPIATSATHMEQPSLFLLWMLLRLAAAGRRLDHVRLRHRVPGVQREQQATHLVRRGREPGPIPGVWRPRAVLCACRSGLTHPCLVRMCVPPPLTHSSAAMSSLKPSLGLPTPSSSSVRAWIGFPPTSTLVAPAPECLNFAEPLLPCRLVRVPQTTS